MMLYMQEASCAPYWTSTSSLSVLQSFPKQFDKIKECEGAQHLGLEPNKWTDLNSQTLSSTEGLLCHWCRSQVDVLSWLKKGINNERWLMWLALYFWWLPTINAVVFISARKQPWNGWLIRLSEGWVCPGSNILYLLEEASLKIFCLPSWLLLLLLRK